MRSAARTHGGIAQRSERSVVNRCQRGFDPHFRLRAQCPSSMSDRTLGYEPGGRGSTPRMGAASSHCLSHGPAPGCPSPLAPVPLGVQARSVSTPASQAGLTGGSTRGLHHQGVAQPEERQSGRLEAAGADPVALTNCFYQRVAQLEERQHRKLEAAGAGPVTLTAVVSVSRGGRSTAQDAGMWPPQYGFDSHPSLPIRRSER